MSADALQRFFTHSLTQTLTYNARLTGRENLSASFTWLLFLLDDAYTYILNSSGKNFKWGPKIQVETFILMYNTCCFYNLNKNL